MITPVDHLALNLIETVLYAALGELTPHEQAMVHFQYWDLRLRGGRQFPLTLKEMRGGDEMVSPKQLFECPHCGHTVESTTMDDCDQLEGSGCPSCHFGSYEWVGPVGTPTQGSELPAMDDVDADVDAAFERITSDDV